MKDEIKEKFGWKFDKDKDEHYTETDLDHYTQWDYVIQNQGEKSCLDDAATVVISTLESQLPKKWD